MQCSQRVKLGDLIAFAQAPQPGEYGIVVQLGLDFVEIMWPWGLIECSYSTFVGERWGNLRVVTDDD